MIPAQAQGTGVSNCNPVELRGYGFRMYPIAGPAQFPRQVRVDGVSMTVADASPKLVKGAQLLITAASTVLPGLLAAVPASQIVEAEQWQVEVFEDECDQRAAVLPRPRSMQKLFAALGVVKPANTAYLSPVIDARGFEAVVIAQGSTSGDGPTLQTFDTEDGGISLAQQTLNARALQLGSDAGVFHFADAGNGYAPVSGVNFFPFKPNIFRILCDTSAVESAKTYSFVVYGIARG